MTSRCWLRTRFRSKSRGLHRLNERFGELPESPPRSCPAALFSCYTARIPPVEREQATCGAGGVLANNDSSGLALLLSGSVYASVFGGIVAWRPRLSSLH